MSKKLMNFVTTVFVVLGMLSVTSSALADGGGSKGELKGTIAAIAGSDLTVAGVTVHVDGSTLIKRDGKSALLTDLLLGDRVEVKYDITTMIASRIEDKTKSGSGGGSSSQGEVEGTISVVGTTSLTVTPKKGGADVTVNVDSSTRIKRNGKPALLADLLVGDRVKAKFDKTTMLASRIEDKTKTAGGKVKNGEIHGVIFALDATTVTITPSTGGANVVLTVDLSTRFERGHLHITLADLLVGDKVEAKFNSTTLLASKIEAR